MAYAALVARDRIPQTRALDVTQAPNNGGGFSFVIDRWARLDRFLILGSDGGTYYQSARKLTAENAACVRECWAEDAARTAARVSGISDAGRAPKNSPAILALAIGLSSESVEARRAASDAVKSVCRTASHLFELIQLCDALGRGMGRTLKRAVREWYESRPVEALAYQMTKYRERNGYSHKRLIQRARPRADGEDGGRIALYRWGIGRDLLQYPLPEKVEGHVAAMATTTADELVPLVARHRLERETVPTWAHADGRVWEALLPNLGLTALVRNLSTLSAVGVIKPLGEHNVAIAERIADAEAIRKSRVHPYALLQALAVYRSGRAVKGQRTWQVDQSICDALDRAFYLAFSNVEPTGKRHLLAIDCSDSMTWDENKIGGVLQSREAAAAMALAVAKTEKRHHILGFGSGLVDLGISPSMRLDQVTQRVRSVSAGGTDCALPMLHALKHGIEVDAFLVFTDNETNSSRSMHPSEALRRYRKETGIPAKLVVAAMSSTGFSIADPNDAGMLDVVGFDSDAVSVMADFVRS